MYRLDAITISKRLLLKEIRQLAAIVLEQGWATSLVGGPDVEK